MASGIRSEGTSVFGRRQTAFHAAEAFPKNKSGVSILQTTDMSVDHLHLLLVVLVIPFCHSFELQQTCEMGVDGHTRVLLEIVLLDDPSRIG